MSVLPLLHFDNVPMKVKGQWHGYTLGTAYCAINVKFWLSKTSMVN